METESSVLLSKKCSMFCFYSAEILALARIYKYCKPLNIRGLKFLGFNENDILVYFNFGIHNISWLKIVKKILCKSLTFYLTVHCVIF